MGAYGAALTHSWVGRVYDNWVLEQSLKGEPASVNHLLLVHLGSRLAVRPLFSTEHTDSNGRALSSGEVPPFPQGGLIGKLEISKISLSVVFREGTDPWTLNRSVGHIEKTALPWEPGNVGIAGHRDGFFRGLKNISRNDTVTLSTLKGNYLYRVDGLEIVDPEDTQVLRNRSQRTLTLVTCYPFYYVGDAPKRFVVSAHLESGVGAP